MTRYRVRWSRRGKLRYLSANDVDTVLERSVRRAKLPVAYSKGFTPHPKISFATALPVGYGSVSELMDMTLTESLAPDVVKDRFNGGLPEDLRIEGVSLLDDGTPKLGAIVTGADYEIAFAAAWLPAALERFMALDRYDFVRRFKSEERTDDLRAGVISARASGESIAMRCLIQPKAVRPSDVIVALAEIADKPAPHVAIERVRLLAGEPDALLPIDESGIHEAVISMSTEAPRRREKATDIENLPETEDVKAAEPKKKTTRRRRGGRGGGPKSAGDQPKAAETQATAEAPAQTETSSKSESQNQTKPRSSGRSKRRGGPRRRNGRTPRPQVERVMFVHNHEHGPQIAVVEEGRVVEMYVARSGDTSYVGNVYLGRVQNVLPGMEASFVDIGESRNGVLYAGEVGIAGDEGDEIPRIETVLKSGQPILVQVTKDPMRSKGARLTALVSIAGRHLVLVPNAKSIGVSRRLTDSERTRLRDLVAPMRPKEHGLIVRTAAEGAGQADLERDLEQLLETWKEIEEKSKKANAPALLYSEPQLELRVIRDLFNRDVTRCVVDDPELESTIRSYVRSTSPDLDHRLELYEGELPIFEENRIAEQIRKSLDRRVWLPSGGHIVIDRTEAMAVIDVNTGKFVGKKTLEETVFHANKEAAIEVARQLRLRDIGGIIVIDFIDMEDASNREQLFSTFRNELEKDRTRTQVFDISPLGLVQMTRKNVSAGIVETFSDPCPDCEGRGILIHDLD